MNRVFANGPGDRSSIPGRVIPKTLKMVLDASLLNTQHTHMVLDASLLNTHTHTHTYIYMCVITVL